MSKFARFWGMVCFAASLTAIAPAASGQAPITVGSDGSLIRNGVRYRAVGVNYSDAFQRVLENPADTSYTKGFAELRAAGIPFVRFPATGHWPRQLKEFQTDRSAYLAKLDGVISAAESNGIGLIPSLFWADFTVPDVVGEPRSAWGNLNSRTVAFMKEYTTTLVQRYKNSPAIWAWEFGNEYSLSADLPNAADWRPPIVPQLGTPSSRSAADDLKTSMILVAFKQFAETVRASDSIRPITSGNSLPRNYAEDLRAGYAWQHLDTYDAFERNIALVNPPPLNMVSVHIYADDLRQQRFTPNYLPTVDDLIGVSVRAARKQHMATFLGEFGANDGAEGAAGARRIQEAFLQSIVRNGVDLAAVWVFDRVVSNDANTAGWNITPTNGRSYLLDLIRQANQKLVVQ
jgi:cellulase (glycosyl hydrolase family 5)